MTSIRWPENPAGSALLRTFLYWWLVYHTGEWALGITAYAVAVVINLFHTLLTTEAANRRRTGSNRT